MQDTEGHLESPAAGDAEASGFALADAPGGDAPGGEDDKLSVESRILNARATNFGAAPNAEARLIRRSGSQLLLPCPHCGRATPKTRKECVQCGATIVTARPEEDYDAFYNQERSDVQLASIDEWRGRMAAASQKLVELIVGRTVIRSGYDSNQFVAEFDNGSNLIVETTGATKEVAPSRKVVALQQGFDFDAPALHLDFENGKSLDLPLAASFNSVMVMSRENAILYAD